MDIRNNKTFLHSNIKHFTLKATASVILTLNAETVIAATCPPTIFTDIEGVCEFVHPITSVTVENGGTVGGISMDTYTPQNSFIRIDSGGLISNTTGIAINIQNSSLSNGLTNNGTISSAAATGIKILTSTINGGIFNSGTIDSNGGNGISITNTSTVNGDITNLGGINANSGNGIILHSISSLQGGISNNGRIESASDNGITVSVNSIIQDNITNRGIISGGLNGILIRSGSTVGGIANSETIRGGEKGIHISISSTVDGAISNTGTISGTTGINISTTSIVNGSISNSGTIQGDAYAINIDNSSTVENINILGESARIIGTVEATNTDVNITNGALFTSEGTYNVNTFNVAENALFNIANTIAVANGLNNAGTLAVTNSLQTISGSYTQSTGGTFQTGVSSASNYGQLLVTDSADLSNSGNIYVLLGQSASLRAGDVLSNVISGTTFISPTNGFNVTDNSLIWDFTAALNNAQNGVNLLVTLNPSVYNVCKGIYCEGALNTIIGQVAAGNSLFNPYATLSSASALQAAASQATPELTNENIQVLRLITQSVLDVVPMWNNLRGKSAGDEMISQPGKVWIKPYGASMNQNKKNTVNGFNATAYGAVIGKDIELGNNWLLGGAFAAGGDNMRGKSVLNDQSIDSNAYQGIIYGAKKFQNQIYVAGQGLVGYDLNNTKRFIPLYASTAKGSYNSWFTNIRAETGWSAHVFSSNLVLTPEIDASYLFVNQGSYKEHGSPMDLAINSNNNSSLVLGAYCNAAYHFMNIRNQHELTLTGYAGVAGNVINSQPQVTSTFLAGGAGFATPGVQFNEAVFRGGAGLNIANPNSPLVVELNYDLQAGNNAYSGTGAATIKYNF